MTRDAAERLEQLIAVLLLGRQRRGIAAKPAIEPAPGGQQRPLIGGDRVQQARTIGPTPISRLELMHQLGVGTQLSEHVVDAFSHALRTFQASFRLSFQGSQLALPTETKAERRIENGGG